MLIYNESQDRSSQWFAQRLVELLKNYRSEGDMKKVRFIEQLLCSSKKSGNPT